MKNWIFTILLAPCGLGLLPVATAQQSPSAMVRPPSAWDLHRSQQTYEQGELSRQIAERRRLRKEKKIEIATLDAALRLEALDEVRSTNRYYKTLIYCYQSRDCTGEYGDQLDEFKNALPMLISSFRKSMALSRMGVYVDEYHTESFVENTQNIQLQDRFPTYVFNERSEREEIVNKILFEDRFRFDYMFKNLGLTAANDIQRNAQRSLYASSVNYGAKNFYFLQLNTLTTQFPFLLFITHRNPSDSEVIYALSRQVADSEAWIKEIQDPDKVSIDYLLFYDYGVLRVSSKYPHLIPLMNSMRGSAAPEEFSITGFLLKQGAAPALGVLGCFFAARLVKWALPVCIGAGYAFAGYGIYSAIDKYLLQTRAILSGMTDMNRLKIAYYDIYATVILTLLPLPAAYKTLREWSVPKMLEIKVTSAEAVQVLKSPKALGTHLAQQIGGMARFHAQKTIPLKLGATALAGAVGVGQLHKNFQKPNAQARISNVASQPEIFMSYGEGIRESRAFLKTLGVVNAHDE